MKESKRIEYKEKVTNTFLKTVSAYANYGTGEVFFGIQDDGEIVGMPDPAQTCLDIETKINDTIKPVPEFTLSVQPKTQVVVLNVKEGSHKPYFYQSKAYRRRHDTATVEVDTIELTRLILEEQNQTYDRLKSVDRNLQFSYLEKKLQTMTGIRSVSRDILITLGLYRKSDGYTVAGALLADENTYPGIDMVRFGETNDTILDRNRMDHRSILQQYDEAILKYRQYYQYERIQGAARETVETIPEKAFREALANALVHRTWDIDAQIRILMLKDRMEVISPGGLPSGVSEREYKAGQISVLRNPVIGNVFFRLNLIEQFGTGIQRILSAYQGSASKPIFELFENSIKVVLPLLESCDDRLESDERMVFRTIAGKKMASSEVAALTGFGKSKALDILKRLSKKGYVKVHGNGRGTKYSA